MSLVAAYDDSSEEESEEEAPPVPLGGKKGLSLPPPKKVAVPAEDSRPEPTQKQPKSMFSVLPAPKRDVLAELIEETDEPIPASINSKQKVKISIPSLSKYADEEDEPKPKKQRIVPKGSGLLAILPEPVNGMTSRAAFMPHVLTKKPTPAPPKAVKKPPPKPPAQKPALVTNYSESDDDSEDEFTSKSSSASGVDFFSLTNQVQPTPAEINLDELLPQAGPSRPEKLPETTYATVEEDEWEETPEQSNEDTEERELTDEAIRKLCGRRQEDMSNMIDIQGESVYADAKEWMLKNLTEEPEQDFSHRDNTPNPTMRRKHQITYLAFQAKERETELKNQWAANRMSKKQTQAKYGF
ncbi:proline-rich protein PRCC [Cloeon dipterum]|uniref:proline-rich protein PRCC n=1 Tax=Cloeon dipterum TaxID=197152 RepID=UPI0032203030